MFLLLQVVIIIFWLGRSVFQFFSGFYLDQSVFFVIVRYSGKDFFFKERFRNDLVDFLDQIFSVYSLYEINFRVSNDDFLENKYIRDSFCDFFVFKEFVFSLDLEDESMLSFVNSKMRRYNSVGFLNISGGYYFFVILYGINVDDYGNLNFNYYRRGLFIDSMDSSSYLGNYSRQFFDSVSVDILIRILKIQRKVSFFIVDLFQFVKFKLVDVFVKIVQEQIEVVKEIRLFRVVILEKEDVDW